ncbi:MAG: IS110 family transposase [Bacteroidetes bacterium]|nr:IS110 family transposase [Bacteroidota bacterium]
MAKKAKKIKNGNRSELLVVNPNAAGIDVASTEYQVCVPEDRDCEPNRRFEAFTCDLHSIAAWLKECKIETVAMEATGIYWVQVFMVLQEYGFDVVLCNAKHVKNIGEKKTDFVDASWIQVLHTYGLLKESFQPDNQIRQLKDLMRQRERLIQRCSQDLLRIQKALEMMNIKAHKVLSDIKGKSGISILKAIIAGERSPNVLADLVDSRVKATRGEIVKSLEGNWNDAQLLVMKQNYDAYCFALKQQDELDRSIEHSLQSYSQTMGKANSDKPIERSSKKQQGIGNGFHFDAEKYSNDILGVNITRIPGISSLTAVKIISELGSDFTKKFESFKHFCSWANVVPNNRISGGKILSSTVPKRKNFVGQAFRVAANTLSHSKGYLGDYFRRMRSRLGYNQAIIAVAHKLARIVFKMVSVGVEYDESIDREKNYNLLTLKRNSLQKRLAKLEKEISLSACYSDNMVLVR